MDTERFLNFETEDFILDDDFLRWVLHPDKERELFWAEFLQKYPCKKAQVEEAAFILRGLQPVEPKISLERINAIKSEIKHRSTSYRRISLAALKAAAILIFLITIGGLVCYFLGEKQTIPFETASEEFLEKGKLILADGTVREFETEKTNILQTNKGAIAVNNDTIATDINTLKTYKSAMNQVIIPYGKRSEITLADGTHIWLNSGSQFSYPVVFEGDSREVYLSGEAFFDIKADPSKPFYVISKDIKIRVSGTRFNVSSYENDHITHTVLLSGKISVAKNKKFAREIEVLPGERLSYVKADESIGKEKVDVEQYASWINGYLILKSEPLNEIFRKLERYYNKRIIIEKGLNNVTFSGKLDLSENIEKVLENISFSSSFSVHAENDYYTIKP